MKNKLIRLYVLLFLISFISCSGNSKTCITALDCGEGEICQEGECVSENNAKIDDPNTTYDNSPAPDNNSQPDNTTPSDSDIQPMDEIQNDEDEQVSDTDEDEQVSDTDENETVDSDEIEDVNSTPDEDVVPVCGNGTVEGDETCDDGVNDGSYGTCRSDCTFASFCSDGTLDILQPTYSDDILLLHFDEGVDAVAADSSGTGNDGTVDGATWSENGIFEKALSFDGVDDIVSWSYTPPANNFTMAAWIKTISAHEVDIEATTGADGVSGQNYLFGADNQGTDSGAGISVGTNGISVYEHGTSYMPAVAVYEAPIGTEWISLIVTYTNKQPRIYINGILVHTGLTSPKMNVFAPTKIGGGSYGFFNGLIDEVRIINRPLTDEEISSSFNESCDDGNKVTEACDYGETGCTVCGENCGLVSGVVSYCGDNVLDTVNSEICDDGNNILEKCAYGETECTVCAPDCTEQPGEILLCGDGVIQPGEDCDDNNADNGDGCNKFCTVDNCWGCAGEPSVCEVNSADPISFDYTGADQTWTVPFTASFTIEVWGAQGQSNGANAATGGLGGYSKADVSLSTGDVLHIFVGSGGSQNTSGGWNGGATAGVGSHTSCNGGGGGGATDIRKNSSELADRVIVAGGGGGAGGNRMEDHCPGAGGGGGGGYYGGGGGGAYEPASMATGGTQSAGGTGGAFGFLGDSGLPGTSGNGGNGGNTVSSGQGDSDTAAAGGAGGGTAGSNGASTENWTGGSGAGGSGYVDHTGNTNTSMSNGIRTGNGTATITPPFCVGSTCGDGTVDAGETCDDGNNNGNSGFCNIDCSGMS